MVIQNVFLRAAKRTRDLRCILLFATLITIGLGLSGNASAQNSTKPKPPKQEGIFPNPESRTKKKSRKQPDAPPMPAAATPLATPQNVAPETPVAPAQTNVQPEATNSNNAPAQNLNNPNNAAPVVVTTPVNIVQDPLFQQVSQVITQLEKDGYRKKDDFIADKMQDDGSWVNDISVQQAKRYVLLAQCDHNCPMMNVRVYDETGKLILIHQEQQARPTIFFTPQRNATYRFRTTVTACRKEPCRAALSVYER